MDQLKFKDGFIWFDDNVRGNWSHTSPSGARLSIEEAEELCFLLSMWILRKKGIPMLTWTEFMKAENLESSPPPEIKEGEGYPLVRLVTQPEKATVEGWYGWLGTDGPGIHTVRKRLDRKEEPQEKEAKPGPNGFYI